MLPLLSRISCCGGEIKFSVVVFLDCGQPFLLCSPFVVIARDAMHRPALLCDRLNVTARCIGLCRPFYKRMCRKIHLANMCRLFIAVSM